MTRLYIGVDFHPYSQTVAYCDEQYGDINYKLFDHKDKKALREFYKQADKDSLIGVEATGTTQWFDRMLSEMGLELKTGNPRLIRRMALSRHKNDYRDAETILDLLITGRFPEIEPRSEYSQLVLGLLRHRHAMVGQRTAIANALQAFARRKGLDRFRTKSKKAKELIVSAVDCETETFMVDSRFRLYELLTKEIMRTESELGSYARKDEKVRLLLTHSGVGPLTALCMVHTLGDVNRFGRKEEVVSYVGLDPLDKSSGEKKRIGRISKHGSRLLRFLLVHSAQTSRDKRIRDFYLKVSRRRGKPIAKVAAARKLLVNCFIMLRDEIDYIEFCRRGEVGLCG